MVIQVLNPKLEITLRVSVTFADVTETRNVIPSLEFKTCMTIKSYVFTVLKFKKFKEFTFSNVSSTITCFVQILDNSHSYVRDVANIL